MIVYYYIDQKGKRHDLTEKQKKEAKHSEKFGNHIVIDYVVYPVYSEIKPDPVVEDDQLFTAKNGFRFALYNVAEAKRKPERKAIIKNYFYEDTINLIYGQSGHGKTWWALYEAVSLVLGKKLLDLDIQPLITEDGEQNPYSVLYVSLEMTARDIGDRIEELCADLTVSEKRTILNNLKIVSFEDNGNMIAGSAGFLPALEELCRNEYFDIVYIDSFTDYIVGFDERSEDQMRRVITDLRAFVVKNHVSFRIIHHGTKVYTDGSGGSMAGIHTIRDLVDCVLSIKQKQDELTITNDQKEDPSAKSRYNKPTTLTAGIKSDGESYFSFYRKEDDEKIDVVAMRESIIAVVSANPGITAGELKNKIYKLDNTVRDSLIGKVLYMLTEKSERGRDRKLFYTLSYYETHKEELDKRSGALDWDSPIEVDEKP